MLKSLKYLINTFIALLKKLFFENKKQILILIFYLLIFSIYLNYLSINYFLIIFENLLIFIFISKNIVKVIKERFLKYEFFIKETTNIKSKLDNLIITNIFIYTFGNDNLENIFTKNFYKIISIDNLKFFILGKIINYIMILVLSKILYNKYLDIVYEDNKIRSCLKKHIFKSELEFDNLIKKIKIINQNINLELLSTYITKMIYFSSFNKDKLIQISSYFFYALKLENLNKERFEELATFFININYLVKSEDEINNILEFLKYNQFPTKIIQEINNNYNYLYFINSFSKKNLLNYIFFESFIINLNFEEILIKTNIIKKETQEEKKILLKEILKIYNDLQLNRQNSIYIETSIDKYYNYFFCYKLITKISDYTCIISNIKYTLELNNYLKIRYKELFFENEERIDKEIREIIRTYF